MLSAILLVGACFLICLAITPFLVILLVVHKWSKWVNGMVCGKENNENKLATEIVKTLIKSMKS